METMVKELSEILLIVGIWNLFYQVRTFTHAWKPWQMIEFTPWRLK